MCNAIIGPYDDQVCKESESPFHQSKWTKQKHLQYVKYLIKFPKYKKSF